MEIEYVKQNSSSKSGSDSEKEAVQENPQVKGKELELGNCGFGDEYIFYKEGEPKYQDIEQRWNTFVDWIKTVQERNRQKEGFDDSTPDRLGGELLKWADDHDPFAMLILIRVYWCEFRDTYLLVDDCPEIVMEFTRGLMHKQMTEKQMWGTDEDRKPKGKLIIFEDAIKSEEETQQIIKEFEDLKRQMHINKMREIGRQADEARRKAAKEKREAMKRKKMEENQSSDAKPKK